MTDLELHDWALARYGSEDLAKKGAIVEQLYRDDRMGDPGLVLYVPDYLPPEGPPILLRRLALDDRAAEHARAVRRRSFRRRGIAECSPRPRPGGS
jgi:hypothetical protein